MSDDDHRPTTGDETRQIQTRIWQGAGADRRVRTRARVPALTVLYHPDSRRVGERILLHELATGKQAKLSRSEPDFGAPGDTRFRPLGDLYLSRKPVRLVHDARSSQIRLIAAESSTKVVVDGVPITDDKVLSPAELERGVVIELARRIVLLLSPVSAMPIDHRERFGLVGDSDGIARLLEEVRMVADLDVPVLLRGETGTGKELAARSIHASSKIRDQAFLSLNMGAITPSLAASELFGAVKGAFTGAARTQPGYFHRADGGTLFLDEIGETPAEVQVMLLRVLETGEVQRVGGQEPQKVDVRLIAATDADLEREIEAGRFREPLLHRLAGYEIAIPPLRERRDDFGRLLFHFLREELRATGDEKLLEPDPHDAPPWMPLSIVARLARYDWPGNVRQLRNIARQLVVGSRGAETVQVPAPVERLLRDAVASPAPVITELAGEAAVPSGDAVAPAPQPKKPKSSFRKPSDVGEEELVEALESNRWELKPTAAELRISRGSLYNLIARFPGIRKASDLSRGEILECHTLCDGDLDRMVDQLEISRSGLQMRMKALDIV